MSPNIKQHVVPRSHLRAGSGVSAAPRWQSHSRLRNQRGSISHNTATAAFGILALVLVGALGFFYLQQVVNTASQGTDVHDLESKIIELREEQRQLELEGAQLRSLQTVENNINQLELVPTDRVSYLVTQPNRVAAAN